MTDLQTILHQMQQTAIYVTHDQEEAFTIADRVILMKSGRIEQIGSPKEIYSQPASIFVAQFLDMTNIVPAFIDQQAANPVVSTPFGNISINSALTGEVNLLIRSDGARLDDRGPFVLRGIVTESSFRGSSQRMTMVANHIPLIFEFPFSVTLPEVGTEIAISLDLGYALKLFTKQ